LTAARTGPPLAEARKLGIDAEQLKKMISGDDQ
jgi:hypothetical protein